MKFIPGDYFMVPNRRLILSQDTHTQALYLSLCSRMDDQGICFPSLSNLEETTGMSKKTILDRIERLEKLGILDKISGNFNTSNKYQVNIVSSDMGSGGGTHPSGGGTHRVVEEVHTNDNHLMKTIEQEEINEFLGFQLPDNWSDSSFIDSDGNFVAQFKDKFSRPIKASEINRLKRIYEVSLKSQATKEKHKDPVSNQFVEILKEAQNLEYLDGGDNLKHALSVKTKFSEHLIKDMGFLSSEVDALIVGQFRAFLRSVESKSQFHWKNLTSFGYLDRNFNKIIRELK